MFHVKHMKKIISREIIVLKKVEIIINVPRETYRENISREIIMFKKVVDNN